MKRLAEELQDFLEHYQQEIYQAAEQIIAEEMPQLTEELFSIYEKTGNRLQYEKVYFTRRKFLAVMGMKACLEKKEGKVSQTVSEKLTEVINSICDEECWALPAHVDRRNNKDWRITVDLFASETAQTLSDISDMLCGILPKDCRRKIEREVERRVFCPYFTSNVPYMSWEHVDTNWNAVCAGSIGSACLHLLREQPGRLEACLNRVCNALPYYVSGFSEDGICMEGLSYYTYGMTYFTNFALELYEFTEGKRDLFQGSLKIAKMAAFQEKCYFEDGRTVSFSDGDSRDKFRMGLSSALAMRFAEAKLPDRSRAAGLHDDTCYRYAALKMDLLETQMYLNYLLQTENVQAGKVQEETVQTEDRQKRNVQKVESQTENLDTELASCKATGNLHVFPSAQWCIGKSKNGVGTACKGGHNAEPHNHNDIGHFIYESDGVLLLTDLGAGEYTREYFSDARYQILCNHSFSHSVPIIDGEGQLAGPEYHSNSFWAEKAKENTFSSSQEKLVDLNKKNNCAIVRMELQGAYRPGLIHKCVRQFVIDLQNGRLKIEDSFCLPASGEHLILENLVTQIRPAIQGNKVILQENGVKAVLEMEGISAEWKTESGVCEKKLFRQIAAFGGRKIESNSSSDQIITIIEYPHSNHKGIQETVYAIQWPVLCQKKSGVCRFCITLE